LARTNSVSAVFSIDEDETIIYPWFAADPTNDSDYEELLGA